MTDILFRFFESSQKDLLSTRNTDFCSLRKNTTIEYLKYNNNLNLIEKQTYNQKNNKLFCKDINSMDKVTKTEVSIKKPSFSNMKFRSTKILPNISDNKEKIFNSSYRTPSFRKRNKLTKKIKINNLINDLISSKENYKQSHFYKFINKKINKFPNTKTIDPLNYIKFNQFLNPNDKKLFSSIDLQIRLLGNQQSYRDKIINTVNNNEYNNLFSGKPIKKIINKKFIKEYNELFNDEKLSFSHKKSIKFRKEDSKLQKYKNIYLYTDQKKYIRSRNDNIGTYSNMNPYHKKILSFDDRIQDIYKSVKVTKKHMNEFSVLHNKMIDKINNVKKYIDISRNMNENEDEEK